VEVAETKHIKLCSINKTGITFHHLTLKFQFQQRESIQHHFAERECNCNNLHLNLKKNHYSINGINFFLSAATLHFKHSINNENSIWHKIP
jgi:hypothetical protein